MERYKSHLFCWYVYFYNIICKVLSTRALFTITLTVLTRDNPNIRIRLNSFSATLVLMSNLNCLVVKKLKLPAALI